MGNVDSTISNTLHDGEDLGASGGAGQSDVQNSLEGVWVLSLLLDVVVFTVDLFGSLVDGVELDILQVTAGQQQTGGVGGGVVGQTNLDAITRKLMSVSGSDDNITSDSGVSDLKMEKINKFH